MGISKGKGGCWFKTILWNVDRMNLEVSTFIFMNLQVRDEMLIL